MDPFKIKGTNSEDFSEIGIGRFLSGATSVEFCFKFMIRPKSLSWAFQSMAFKSFQKNLWNLLEPLKNIPKITVLFRSLSDLKISLAKCVSNGVPWLPASSALGSWIHFVLCLEAPRPASEGPRQPEMGSTSLTGPRLPWESLSSSRNDHRSV